MTQHPNPNANPDTDPNPPAPDPDPTAAVCPVCLGTPIDHGADLPGANEYPLTHGHQLFVDRTSIGGPVLLRCRECNASAQVTTRTDWVASSGFRNYMMLNRRAQELRREPPSFAPCDVCGGTGRLHVSRSTTPPGALNRDLAWEASARRLSDLDPARCTDPNYAAWRELVDAGNDGESTEQGRAFIRGWLRLTESRSPGAPALCPLCRLPDRVVPVVPEDPADTDQMLWDRRGVLVAVPAPGDSAQATAGGYAAAHRHHYHCGRCQLRW